MPHRRPGHLSLLGDMVVGDFVLLVKARSTAFKAGGHRDCCIFFGETVQWDDVKLYGRKVTPPAE